MSARGKQTGVIPAQLEAGTRGSLIDRADQYVIHIYIHFLKSRTALVDNTEGLTCERKCYVGAILRGYLIGTSMGLFPDDILPAGGIHKAAKFVVKD